MSHASNMLFLAIDQGGHASRAMLFNYEGDLVSQGYHEIETHVLPGNRVEHDAEEMIESVNKAIRHAVDAVDKAGDFTIASAGLATQRSSIVCWDRNTGEAISPVISWQDRRAAAWMESFSQYDAEIHKTTGLFTTAHYGVSKLKWCLENLAPVKEACRKKTLAWGPLASFIVFRLTQEHSMYADPANASRTLLWNMHSMNWDSALMRLFGLPEEPFPQCVPTRHDFGNISVGDDTVPLQIVTGDQSAALYAYGEPDLGAVYVNIGTGAFVQHVHKKSLDYAPRLLMSVASKIDDVVTYVLEGTVNGAGSAFVSVEQELGMDPYMAQEGLEDWLGECEEIPLYLNGVSGLGSPFWCADFKSRFVGAGDDREKIVAVAESILFLINVNLEEMARVCTIPSKLVVTGGLSKSAGLCQRLADLTQKTIVRPYDCEATARGTACLLKGEPYDWGKKEVVVEFLPEKNAALLQRFLMWKSEMNASLS